MKRLIPYTCPWCKTTQTRWSHIRDGHCKRIGNMKHEKKK